MKDNSRKRTKKVKHKNVNQFPKPSSHSIFDIHSSSQSENNNSKNYVFGRVPLSLIKKFGNIAKSCNDKASAKINHNKIEIEACAPMPSGRIASSTEESSNDSDYIIFEIVPSREERSYGSKSKAIDLTGKFIDSNPDLSTCSTSNVQSRIHTRTRNDFFTTSDRKVESDLSVSSEYGKCLTPSGLPHPKRAGRFNNFFTCSSSNVSEAMRKLLNDETEARYTESTSLSTDYEYLSDINSIHKTNFMHCGKSESKKSNTYSEPSTTQSYSSIASKQSCCKLTLMREVTIGNRYKNPVTTKTVKCKSLHSIASTSSSFLDRKFRGLAYGSMNSPAEKVVQEVSNEHACTQTERRSSSHSLKGIISQHSSSTLSNHNSLSESSSACGRAKIVWKISNEGLNEHFIENKCLKNDLVPSASTKLVPTKQKELLLKSSMCQTESGLFENEPTKVNQTGVTKPFTCNKQAKASVSVGCDANLRIDCSQFPSSCHDVLPEEHFEVLPVQMKTKDNENKRSSPSSQGIKILLNELNDEINGVRKVIKNSEAKSSCDVTNSAAISTITNLSQTNERFVADDSLTGQLADMINELQSTLFSYINEITKKKTIEFSGGVSFRNPLNLISNLNSSSLIACDSDNSEASEFSGKSSQVFDSKTRLSCSRKRGHESSRKKRSRRNTSSPKTSKSTAFKKLQSSTMDAIRSFLRPGASLSSEKVFRRKDYVIAQQLPGNIKLYQYQDKKEFRKARRSNTGGNSIVRKEIESKSEPESNVIPCPSCRPLRRKKTFKKSLKLEQTDRSHKHLAKEEKTNSKHAKRDSNQVAENESTINNSSHDDLGKFVSICQANSAITLTAKSPSAEKSESIVDPSALKVTIGSLSKTVPKSNNGRGSSKTVASASKTTVRSVTFEDENHNCKSAKQETDKKQSKKSTKCKNL